MDNGLEEHLRAETCPECGASIPRDAVVVPGEGIHAPGLAACQALWQQFSTHAYQDPLAAAVHDLAFDAYCMQHLEQYCVSAKSYAAHLARLCCGLEYGGSPQVYAAIQRWLSGNQKLEKPPAPASRGALTVVTLLPAISKPAIGEPAIGKPAIGTPDLPQRVRSWAEGVWDAYAFHHALARDWTLTALNWGTARSYSWRR